VRFDGTDDLDLKSVCRVAINYPFQSVIFIQSFERRVGGAGDAWGYAGEYVSEGVSGVFAGEDGGKGGGAVSRQIVE
jgi:hypothetical protein